MCFFLQSFSHVFWTILAGFLSQCIWLWLWLLKLYPSTQNVLYSCSLNRKVKKADMEMHSFRGENRSVIKAWKLKSEQQLQEKSLLRSNELLLNYDTDVQFCGYIVHQSWRTRVTAPGAQSQIILQFTFCNYWIIYS